MIGQDRRQQWDRVGPPADQGQRLDQKAKCALFIAAGVPKRLRCCDKGPVIGRKGRQVGIRIVQRIRKARGLNSGQKQVEITRVVIKITAGGLVAIFNGAASPPSISTSASLTLLLHFDDSIVLIAMPPSI